MHKEELLHIIEALIFASDYPVTVKHIQDTLKDIDAEHIDQAIQHLLSGYENNAFEVKKVGGGYQFATKPQYAKWINIMFEEKARSRLSRAALETLAIVAFKQPISRVEISAVRGVNSDGVMKTLLDAKLVTIAGRDKGPGRALLFKTTPEFLIYFGIDDINDLPRPREIEELLAEGEAQQVLAGIQDEELLSESNQVSTLEAEKGEKEKQNEKSDGQDDASQ